jgi:hypothetical protein
VVDARVLCVEYHPELLAMVGVAVST